ncbi:hypothetical protein AVEN_19621-1 [Araneus ventricosus]|uniref:Uncharacterized protein n=1 Tax=Araneus ventricosus TaxID=182803 RepID=A0A4Y2MY36_ARAVE|nr:hypothetical protein AVEN_19621-1 [Araneus ventricosus]
MFILGDLGTMEVSKVRRVFPWSHCKISTLGCRIVLLELSQSVGMHNGHEMSVSDRTGRLAHVTSVRARLLTYQGPISRQLHTSHTITEAPPLNSLLLTNRVYD